ncbi:MAG: host-nuclease inhibitor Gam family protein [Sphingomonadaceae bacterium]
MARKSKVKTSAVQVPVPQNDDEATAQMRRIGDARREMERLTADLGDRIASLQEEYSAMASPQREQIAALSEGLKVYAEANRARLTDGGKRKFHDFATGRISWRKLPPKVSLRKVDTVIAALKAAGLHRFVRTKEEVNKDAMLASEESRATAAAIAGVTIGSGGEEFIAEPDETILAG